MEKTIKSMVSRDSDKFMLRFPDGMRDKIAEAAKANNRSMNAEIVARLEGSFGESTSPDRVFAMFDEYKQKSLKIEEALLRKNSLFVGLTIATYTILTLVLDTFKEHKISGKVVDVVSDLEKRIRSLFGTVLTGADLDLPMVSADSVAAEQKLLSERIKELRVEYLASKISDQ